MSNELDIFTEQIKKSPILDFYFILNCIDILNYVVFVVLCSLIDVYMIVKLKKVSIAKSKVLNNSKRWILKTLKRKATSSKTH